MREVFIHGELLYIYTFVPGSRNVKVREVGGRGCGRDVL